MWLSPAPPTLPMPAARHGRAWCRTEGTTEDGRVLGGGLSCDGVLSCWSWRVAVWVAEGCRVMECCRAGGGEFSSYGGLSVLSRGQLSVLRELSAGRTRSLRGIMNRGR